MHGTASADAPTSAGEAGAGGSTPTAAAGPSQPVPVQEEADLAPPRRRQGWVRVVALLAVMVVVGTIGVFVGFHFWRESTYFVVTDNAQVTGDLIQVGSLNAGRIVAARFEVGQAVQAGQEMAVVRIPQEVGMSMGGTMVLEEPAAGDRLASVRAPFSGAVVARTSHLGGTVAAGHPIYAIVDPSRVWVRANVEETKLARVRPGQAVDVYMDALAVVSSLGSLTVRLLEQGVSAASSASIALGHLNDRTKEVASVRAYDDCFLVFAGITLLTLLPVLLVPRRREHR